MLLMRLIVVTPTILLLILRCSHTVNRKSKNVAIAYCCKVILIFSKQESYLAYKYPPQMNHCYIHHVEHLIQTDRFLLNDTGGILLLRMLQVILHRRFIEELRQTHYCPL